MAQDTRKYQLNTTVPTLTRIYELPNWRSYDEFHGGAGHDYLSMLGSKDGSTLYGGGGHDRLQGGDAEDELHGGSGHDSIHGGGGTDHIFGGSGHDFLRGGWRNNGE